METPSSDRPAWTCPACTRHVPRRVDVCRCGFSPGDVPVDDAVPAAGDLAPDSSRRGTMLAVGLVVVVGAAMFPFLSRRAAPPPVLAPAAVPVVMAETPARADASDRSFADMPDAVSSAALVQPPAPVPPALVAEPSRT